MKALKSSRLSFCLGHIVAIGIFLTFPAGGRCLEETLVSGDGGSPIDFGSSKQSGGGCIYSHNFTNVGESTYLYSENYPNSYFNNLDCRYYVNSPRGTQMTLECDEFNVESTTNCAYDIFYWSLTGDAQFRDRDYACGTGQLSQKKTYGNSLAMGFKSDASNPAGAVYKYRCQIKVVPTPCSCGVSGATSRIVGGSQALVAEHPWRVALFTSDGLFCAGALIHNNWVMTAAHCTKSVQPGKQIYADLGDHDLSSTSDANNQVILVDRIMENSLYNDETQDSDIALLHLSRPVQYAKNIQPLCLPWKYTSFDFNNKIATASGWGTTYYGGPQSNILLKVDLDVQNTQTCRSTYYGRNVKITDNMFCAYRENKDTCQSDSGGSLDFKDPNNQQYYGIGVVSFGFGCARKNYPGVYTQVVNFLGWIEQNTGETYCKA